MSSSSALRETVLSGRFTVQATEAEAFADFLCSSGVSALAVWFDEATLKEAASDPDFIKDSLDRDIALIDRMLSRQLDAVLHQPAFQKLEGSWCGLRWLVGGLSPEARVFVRVLSVRWAEICRDFQRSSDFDTSALFHLIYENEFGLAGGEPFGLMVVDHEFRHVPEARKPGGPPPVDDITALNSLAAVAAAAFCPMVIGVSPVLFGVERFNDLSTVVDPVTSLKDADKRRWQMLRRQTDARFLCACLPHVLGRLPWGHDPARADGFFYRERASAVQDRVWTSAAYAFASVVIRAQIGYGWPADIRGVPPGRVGGGLVPDLVSEIFDTDPQHGWYRSPLDIQLTEEQERMISAEGFMPLVSLSFGPEACFSSVNSIQQIVETDGTAVAAANRHLSSQINTLLCVSRFAHYVKVLGRAVIGSHATPEKIERRLQSWLRDYTNSSVKASEENRARYPLMNSKVTISEKPGYPGHFSCVMHLEPRYQLDQVDLAFNLATELVAPDA
ncbi:type VI secretion system contractile sheath large subunit [Acetobacter sp.]|jgi:type VI secretion system protein ImpD/type VI secretion system protein ImpC|uniref:type VI secretion system contractile sheath large subunit n=1 Tax=Acetobacter sp. TaxID=440 RepID=UPI0025C67BC0|nr:type VI secretion system contractile sheath large subunit [Acetobacter sp.]MCH4092637.1 type VI secretion system contractile sheath large subunit [Acetobacter sp.]MCI1299771.1 type VI secretion system contractile sheath large subunit [Acetobacter sp.]MCI1315349.1 type VI secretion system contractile sheath large subunit [Acetobacter sp.]